MQTPCSFSKSSSEEDFDADAGFLTPSRRDFASCKEPLMYAIDQQDVAQINNLLAEPKQYKDEYILEYIEFSIAKTLLDISKNLLNTMFYLAAQQPNCRYDLSKICQQCLATIDYNQLTTAEQNQWQDLLIQHIIEPANPEKASNKNKFSLSISEECREICEHLKQTGQREVVEQFAAFYEKYQPPSISSRRKFASL